MYATYNECPNNGVDFEEFYFTFSPEDEGFYKAFLSFTEDGKERSYTIYVFGNPHVETRSGKGLSVEVLLGYSQEALLREEGRRSRPRDWQDERD